MCWCRIRHSVIDLDPEVAYVLPQTLHSEDHFLAARDRDTLRLGVLLDVVGVAPWI